MAGVVSSVDFFEIGNQLVCFQITGKIGYLSLLKRKGEIFDVCLALSYI